MTLQSKANVWTELLQQRQGPLTRELLLAPGGFGLGQVPDKHRPDATVPMVCGYCATGCGLQVHLQGQIPVSLSPSANHPVNLGMACPKGWQALTVLDAPDRAKSPLLRNENGDLTPVDWDTAARTFVQRFQQIQQHHGPDSVAFLSTGQMPTEEMAFLGAFAKFGMGVVHGDGNTRQCMATSVVAYKEAFGFDAPPYTYADLEASDVIVLIGSNLCIAHPILWERVMRNPHHPEIIVLDPRTTETAMQATQHLALQPKSDQTLLYGLARILIKQGWVNERFIADHTRGFDDFAAFVQDFPFERVIRETRLPQEAIQRLAETIHRGERVSFWWTMGVNQSYQGVRTAQAIINLALMTGNIGRPGTGANSITGQANAMGSRMFSNTTNLFGGRDFANPQHRAEVAAILKIDEARIPSTNSWSYHEIFEGVLRGKIRGVWVVCTNPAHSWVNQNLARDILERLDFLVVQDMYDTTETAQLADLVLPAAAWGEKEGTFINSERRVGAIHKVARAPGQALSDFAIFRLLAEYWGCGDMFSGWESPAAVFQLLKRLSEGRPCDLTGIADYADLDRRGGVQWPCPQNTPTERAERRLFEDGQFYHADGRARFVFEPPRPLPEPPSAAYPFLLLTGRGSVSQWHTQTRTAKSAVLAKLAPRRIYVELNQKDAQSLGIHANDFVTIASQRGRIQAQAVLTQTVPPGSVFLPMHYESVNQLTDAVFDPYSKQPSYKACAVRVSK